MSQNGGNRRLVRQYKPDGVAIARVRVTPTVDGQRVDVPVVDEAVPVILVPGIMGSNLRNKETGESVWRANSVIRLAMQWIFRSASTRRKKLNPDTTEVDTDGAYMGGGTTATDKETEKERGWGTVAKYGYGKFVPWLDVKLNEEEASPWNAMEDSLSTVEKWTPYKAPEALSQSESENAWAAYCPVHCVGYNWLQSNSDSGRYLSEKIDEIMAYWRSQRNERGALYRCQRVVLVTHSMGGLVSRAAVLDEFRTDPDTGTQAPDIKANVAGIVHGVMPAFGAAAAYHHIRTGYDFPTGLVLGRNAAQVTAILGNSPGGLELVPNCSYPAGWLQARSSTGEELMALPKAAPVPGAESNSGVADPYLQIYTKRHEWYRLIDEALVDPAGLDKKTEPETNTWTRYLGLVVGVAEFHQVLGNHYHDPTYSHYGNDPQQKTYQSLVWEAAGPVAVSASELEVAGMRSGNSDPATLELPNSPKFGIAEPADAGDDTVPSVSGGAPGVIGNPAVKQSFSLIGLSHGSSFQEEDGPAQLSTLYAIGKIIGRTA